MNKRISTNSQAKLPAQASQKLLQPQEFQAEYIIPALRREFALALKQLGKDQKEIALLLGISESAVSQYIHQKRAQFALTEELKSLVFDSAPKITNSLSLVRETQFILNFITENKSICKLHELVPGIPKGCNICFEKKDSFNEIISLLESYEEGTPKRTNPMDLGE